MIVFLAALIIQKTYIYAQDEDTVNYDSLTDEADYSEIDSTLDDYGWKGTSFKELVRSVASSDTDIGFNFTGTVTEAIISNRTVLIQILLLSICAMFLTVLDKNASDSAIVFRCRSIYTRHSARCFFRQLHIRVGHQVLQHIMR